MIPIVGFLSCIGFSEHFGEVHCSPTHFSACAYSVFGYWDSLPFMFLFAISAHAGHDTRHLTALLVNGAFDVCAPGCSEEPMHEVSVPLLPMLSGA